VLMWLVSVGVWLRFSMVVGHHAAQRILRKLKGVEGNSSG